MVDDPDRALRDGWLTSLRACSVVEPPPAWVTLWRRRKWWIIGAAVLALETLVMGTLGKTIGTHF